MRTTIDIPTPLFKRAKAAAAEQGTTLRAVIVHALETHLAKPQEKKPYKFEWEGVDLGPMTDEQLWEAMEHQERRWFKEYVREEQARERKKR